MTYKQFTEQANDPNRELFVSYKRRNQAGEIVNNWGSYTSKAIFKRDWTWLKKHIESCNVVETKTGRNWFWNHVNGWTEM